MDFLVSAALGAWEVGRPAAVLSEHQIAKIDLASQHPFQTLFLEGWVISSPQELVGLACLVKAQTFLGLAQLVEVASLDLCFLLRCKLKCKAMRTKTLLTLAKPDKAAR